MKKNKSLYIIQPLLANYRKTFFEELTNKYNCTVFADLNPTNGFHSPKKTIFNKIHTPVKGIRSKVYYQRNIIVNILKNKPDIIFITHDFRSISFWLVLHIAFVLRIPIFGHGQGLYDKPNPSLLHKFIFRYTIKILTQYICYTLSVKESLEKISISNKKLSILSNTIVNNFPIKPNEKTEIDNKKLFYLGRLRKGSRLELLFKVMILLKKRGQNFSLEVIGDGEEKQKLQDLSDTLGLNVVFHGQLYNDEKISQISKKCRYGIYPGDSGLSIVHYMSLSLIPIVHNNLSKHMGPEPSYVNNNINGLNFERNSIESLANILIENIQNISKQEEIAQNSFKTYNELVKESMSEKLIKIIESNIL